MNSVIDILQERIRAIKSMSNVLVEPERVLPYHRPPLSLLKEYPDTSTASTLDAGILEEKLDEYGIPGTVIKVHKGPVITRFEVKLNPGVRISKVRNVSEDLSIALKSDRIRVLAPIPGTDLVGLEVANDSVATIGLKPAIMAALQSSYELPMVLGTDTVGQPAVVDLAKMPHLLVAGQTGSGKSVCLNALIMTILYTKTPDECQLILVDPKRVEMTHYRGMPHLRMPVVTDPAEAVEVIAGLVQEMEDRYKTLEKYSVRNIVSYHALKDVPVMPYIVTVIDEMADLMDTAGKELEGHIKRLAQLARAVGIHLVLATQKPVVDVITGLIKGNIPSRIAFQVASKSDSRVILDSNGAEKLIGRGDMLARPGSGDPVRYHGAWVSDQEITAVTQAIKGVDDGAI
jgi:S-DNA-T family DNA segregation ATPase FtsK/SpoIIIE